jgi:hypothetical protein
MNFDGSNIVEVASALKEEVWSKDLPAPAVDLPAVDTADNFLVALVVVVPADIPALESDIAEAASIDVVALAVVLLGMIVPGLLLGPRQ